MSRCRARYAIVVRTSVQVAAVAVLEGEVPQAFGGAQPGEHGLCHQARKIRGTLKFWVKRCQTERHCPYENCHFGYIPFSDPN